MIDKTQPVSERDYQSAPRLTIASVWKDPNTGATYVHRDLTQVQDSWAEEAHVGPMKVAECFGDVESFVRYVQKYAARTDDALLTWNSKGLRAVLDYMDGDDPGRRTWLASHPFTFSPQWREWTRLASGNAVGQREAVEALEDLAEDIKEPSAGVLMALLRSLRTSVNAQADAELRPDGTTSVSFTKESNVKAGVSGTVEVPSTILISIPILKGHLTSEGKPIVYGIKVRLRVSVGETAKLALRFSIPNAETILEDVYAQRVEEARKLLGETFELLRAADSL